MSGIDLNDDDVIAVVAYASPLGPMFKFRELKHKIANLQSEMFQGANRWFGSAGIDCEVLDSKTGGWIKGKFYFRLVMEFVPNEPDSKT